MPLLGAPQEVAEERRQRLRLWNPFVRAKTVGASASNVFAKAERALTFSFVACSICPLGS
jgi:hypothetical protein